MALVVTSPGDKVAQWQRSYARRLILTDLIVIAVSVFGAQYLRFGFEIEQLRISPEKTIDFATSYTTFSFILVAGWMVALHYYDTRDYRLIGTGPTEYKLVFNCALRVFGVLAIIAFLTQTEVARGYLLIAFPTGVFFLLLTRWLWRKWLHGKRLLGKFAHRAIIVGDPEKNLHVVEQINREPLSGYIIVGAVTEQVADAPTSMGKIQPVLGYKNILTTIDLANADTLILTNSDVLSPRKLRRLGWALENRGVELVVAPAMTDIAGPRIHTRPVAGLPLIHIEYPKFDGSKYLLKRAFDILSSGVLLVALSPIFTIIAISIRLDSKGPVIFRQGRIGINNSTFKMLKFRSMVVDAEAKLAQLSGQSEGNGVLFKMKEDPRVTKIGGFLRRYSLDELPQLINVFKGDMSLVGPRPPLPIEVEQYDEAAGRRLLVKPGITGLWQVSGRSDLSWDDSVRLDLYYVENWSMMTDVQILFRTFKAVISPSGAY